MGWNPFNKRETQTLGLGDESQKSTEAGQGKHGEDKESKMEVLRGMAELGDASAKKELRMLELKARVESGEATDEERDEITVARIKDVGNKVLDAVMGTWKGIRAAKKGVGEIIGGAKQFISEIGAGNEQSWARDNEKTEARLAQEQEKLVAYGQKLGLEDLSKIPSARAKETILGLEPGSRAIAGEVTMGYKFFGGLRKFWDRKKEIRNVYAGQVESGRVQAGIEKSIQQDLQAQENFEKQQAEAPQKAEELMQRMETSSHAKKEKEMGKVYSQMFGQAEQRLAQKARIEGMVKQGKTEEGLVFETTDELNNFQDQLAEFGLEPGKLNILFGPNARRIQTIEKMISRGKTSEGLIFRNGFELDAFYEEANTLGIETGRIKVNIGSATRRPVVEMPEALAA